MADVPYARWYDEGTAAFTKGSTTVTGTSTFWISAGVKAGDIFIDPTGKIYEIANVDSSTQITLRKSYAGDTGTGKGYSIIRMFSSTMNATLANQLATLLSEFERRYDLDMQTVTPKSAYDIAKDNGFSGTQAEWLTSLSAYGVAVKNGYSGTIAEWLESLKAAGEWSTLNSRTYILTYHNAGTHNATYRGKNLGSVFTDAQSAAIRAGTFDDLYIGDYWPITTTYTYYAPTSDTVANSSKTYYADVNGTALATQPEEGADISELAYYEAITGTQTVNWRIAAFDYYFNTGSSLLQTHHAVIVPDQILYKARMNPTDTTAGGYANSEMRTKNLARARALITATFGAGHILTHQNSLTNAVTNGKPSGYGWYNSDIELMSETMVYGNHFSVLITSVTGMKVAYFTLETTILPLFLYRHDLQSSMNNFWLRDVVTVASFATVIYSGQTGYATATNVPLGVRPVALIY